MRKIMAASCAGLVLLHPERNHVYVQSVKMLECMSTGIPVISSNFPLWREIVEGNDCGLCVDSLDPEAIAAAVDFMINNLERARQMGENGKRAVLEKYNRRLKKPNY